MQELGGKVEGLDWVVSGKLQQPREGLETVVELGVGKKAEDGS